jgi:hypothetical protein
VHGQTPVASPASKRSRTPAPPPRLKTPSHTGKTAFPARAGFWGRRNSYGDFVPLTDPGLGGLPAVGPLRFPLVQHLLVVAAAAFLSFVAVLGIMKLRQSTIVPTVAPAPLVLRPPAPPPLPAPVPAPATAPAPAPAVAPPRPTGSAAPRRAWKRSVRRVRQRATPHRSHDLDRPLRPAWLKN